MLKYKATYKKTTITFLFKRAHLFDVIFLCGLPYTESVTAVSRFFKLRWTAAHFSSNRWLLVPESTNHVNALRRRRNIRLVVYPLRPPHAVLICSWTHS